LAALLWPVVRSHARHLENRGDPPVVAIHSAGQLAVAEASRHIAIPRRFSQPMREIWEFQLRLERRRGRKAAELVSHRRFRAAYDFLLLREQPGEETGGLGSFWTEYQALAPEDRDVQPDETENPAGTRRRRRPRTRRAGTGV